jgi:Uma2 family endonuclease
MNDNAPMTEEDYLALLRESEIKYEFIDGEIYAMSGARPSHIVIEANLVGLLYGARHKRDCYPFTSTMAVHTPATGNCFYPDLIVVCGELQHKFGSAIGFSRWRHNTDAVGELVCYRPRGAKPPR